MKALRARNAGVRRRAAVRALCTLLGWVVAASASAQDVAPSAPTLPPPTAASAGAASPHAGFTIAASLRAAAYRMPGVPSVIVHAPPGFDPAAPLHLVVYLHGYSGCLPVLMGKGQARCRPGDAPREGWDLGTVHDRAGTNTLLVVPQLAFMKRNGKPGAFGRAGVFAQFLQELLSETLAQALGGPRQLREVASLTLVAHSAGYQTALAILERGQVESLVHAVVLLDALYGDTESYARYVAQHAASGLHFVALHLSGGRPAHEDLRLQRMLVRKLGAEAVVLTDAAGLSAALATHAIVIASGTPPHWLMPGHHMAQVLAALALPARSHPYAPGPAR